MYFWRTELLVDELQKNSIGENSLKNYYLATAILVTVSFYLALLQPRENLLALAAEASGTLAVTILGVNAAFNANRGSAGVDFLNKAISISFPLLIKVLVAGLVLGIGLAVMESSGVSQAAREWVQSIGTVAITAVLYLRLVVHIRNANA